MALVSGAGLIVFGLFDGQLATVIASRTVVAVAGQAIPPLPAAPFGVFGLWLAAIRSAVVWEQVGRR